MKDKFLVKQAKAKSAIKVRVVEALKESKAKDLSTDTLSKCLMGRVFGSKLLRYANEMVLKGEITLDDLKN